MTNGHDHDDDQGPLQAGPEVQVKLMEELVHRQQISTLIIQEERKVARPAVVVSLVKVMESPGTQTTNKNSNNPSAKKGSKGGRSSKSGQSDEKPWYTDNIIKLITLIIQVQRKEARVVVVVSLVRVMEEALVHRQHSKNSNNPSAKKVMQGPGTQQVWNRVEQVWSRVESGCQ